MKIGCRHPRASPYRLLLLIFDERTRQSAHISSAPRSRHRVRRLSPRRLPPPSFAAMHRLRLPRVPTGDSHAGQSAMRRPTPTANRLLPAAARVKPTAGASRPGPGTAPPQPVPARFGQRMETMQRRATVRPRGGDARLRLQAESGGSGSDGSGSGHGGGNGPGDGDGHTWGDEPDGGMGGGTRAIAAGLLLGAFACLNKWLILWCTDPELTSRVAALLDAGYLSFLGPMAAAALFLSPSLLVPLSQVLLGAAFTHLIGEMLLSASQPGADWRWDLWVHHICSCGLIASALLLRVPAFAADGLRLLVVECTTGVVAALSEARQSGQLSGQRSSAIGILMLIGFTFRWVWTSSLLQKYLMAGGSLQSIIASAGVLPAVLTTAAIAPLWALNFYWASRVYKSTAKVFSKSPST